MGHIDWTLLGSHKGESIEEFIAVLLRRKYPDALQVNPSKGDKGIDVYRNTPEGLVNWQVKKFTSPLTSGQWTQVVKSWNRFWAEKVEKGVKVASYTLVTPWTPTDERRADFAKLTAAATFPTQWDGDSFISGLTDEFPETLERFVKGPNVLDSMVMQKSVLASQPVDVADSLTMMESITVRQTKLNEITNLVSDHYFIDTGTRTMAHPEDWPFPEPDDAGVMTRYTYLGNNRFSYQTLVPRTAQSTNDDPIHLEVQFQVADGSPEAQAVRDWSQWGVPFTDIPAITHATGGPLGDRRGDHSLLSFKPVPSAPTTRPNMRFRIVGADGVEKQSILLRTTEVTQGAATGWPRALAESTYGVLGVELRLGEKDATTSTFSMDRIEGKSPAGVVEELAHFEAMDETDEVFIAIDGAGDILRAGRFTMPTAMTYMGRVAKALQRLQPSTSEILRMPSFDVTMGQLKELERLADIYDGNARTDTWVSRGFTAQADNAELVSLVESGHVIAEVSLPHVVLGEYEFDIERPLVQTARSMRFERIPNGGFIEGEKYFLVPGADNTVVTAAMAGWKKGDPPFDFNVREPAEGS